MDLLHPQPPAVAVIDPRLCQGCGACLACPMQAIRLREGYCAVEPTWCAGHGACVRLVPPTMPRGGLPWRGPTPEQKDRAPWGNPPRTLPQKTPCALRHTVFWFEGQVTPSRPWRGRLCSPWRP